MKQFRTVGTLTELKRGNNSLYGNPSWFVTFVDCFGFEHTAKTAQNASCAYMLDSSQVGKTFEITYHITQNGNMIINYIYKAKE